jgi:Spy/CpxP family protein refolding chaperone
VTKALKWQIALALVLVFFAGLATGVFGTVHHIRAFMFEQRAGHLRQRMTEHLRRELQLTPEQVGKVQPIVERSADRLEEIRTETSRRVSETMRQSHEEIAPHLTPEQKAKLEELEKRHRGGFHGRRPPPLPDAP